MWLKVMSDLGKSDSRATGASNSGNPIFKSWEQVIAENFHQRQKPPSNPSRVGNLEGLNR
jgi:hypothetical protein